MLFSIGQLRKLADSSRISSVLCARVCRSLILMARADYVGAFDLLSSLLKKVPRNDVVVTNSPCQHAEQLTLSL